MNDSPDRQGNWMQTFTGRAFFPLDPRVEDIHELDIAHALSMICRYGGHTLHFYSVAEHCVQLSFAVSKKNALWALLHDAAEAYVGDMVLPLKRDMTLYSQIEDNVMKVICDKFNLSRECPKEVKEADNRILLDEKAMLMCSPPMPWSLPKGIEPLGVTIEGWSPWDAKRKFFDRLDELTA